MSENRLSYPGPVVRTAIKFCVFFPAGEIRGVIYLNAWLLSMITKWTVNFNPWIPVLNMIARAEVVGDLARVQC
jgi:hypothetical protein